ncbi:hypothetical protein GOV09_01655 [Candidatus Woesearchaeota archaeon]|nr:hypothetical protein [Candidatus Woesearchaeota archaeon]
MSWKIKQLKSIKLKAPILIEGLPGIGNVGKVAVDFLIDELEAEKMYELHSHSLPHSVFINEDNLVELPKIEIYMKKVKNQEFLFLSGDVQPSEEVSCYEFTEEIIKICRQHHCKDLIALGGIGLVEIPKKPKLYCTANSKKAMKLYKDKSLQHKLYGVVGPIVGVSGLLLGLADKGTNAVALLAETYGHPMYLGVAGAKEILKFFNKRFNFNVKLDRLDSEIKDMEEEVLRRTDELTKVSSQKKGPGEVNYIG